MASSLYSSGNSLSRSASSVGERHSQTFSIPTLPKRAETFSGFDQSTSNQNCTEDNSSTRQQIVREIDLLGSVNGEEQFELLAGNNNAKNRDQQTELLLDSSNNMKVGFDEMSVSAQGSNSTSILPPPLLSLDPMQQQAAFQMTHYLNSLMCMVSEHFTSLER